MIKFNLSKKAGYEYTFAGCLIHGLKHRDYVKHLQDIHFLQSNFVCNFKKECKQHFDTTDSLVQNIKEVHQAILNSDISSAGSLTQHGRSSNTIPSIMIPCRCDLCGKLFSSVNLLMRHTNVDHLKDQRKCIFKDCASEFHINSVSRNHFNKYHKKTGKMELKSEYLIGQGSHCIRTVDKCPPLGSVYLNPDWRSELEANFNLLIIEKCSLQTRDAWNNNKHLEDPSKFVEIRKEILNRLIDHTVSVYGITSTPSTEVLKEIWLKILNPGYPFMLKKIDNC